MKYQCYVYFSLIKYIFEAKEYYIFYSIVAIILCNYLKSFISFIYFLCLII